MPRCAGALVLLTLGLLVAPTVVALPGPAQVGGGAQAQAEARSGGSRSYGDFEYHANGRLEGHFVTAVLPEGRGTVLAYHPIALGMQVFDLLQVDGGARVAFSGDGHRFHLRGPRADLTIIDDAYATHVVEARSRVDVAYRIGEGVLASTAGDRVVDLGGAGSLVLVGQGAFHLDGRALSVRLESDALLLYRGAPTSGFASEAGLREAVADGRVGAQLLAGWHQDPLVTTVTALTPGVEARLVAPEGLGVWFAPSGHARSFALDATAATATALALDDVAVTVDEVPALSVAHLADAIEDAGLPRFFHEIADDGSLRVVVNTAREGPSRVVIGARASEPSGLPATDASGAFRLFEDGTAVGGFVTLRVDPGAAAVSDFTLLAAQQPVFASLAVGEEPFLAAGSDGGIVLRLENQDARLEFSDTSSGLVRVLAKREADVGLRLATGLRAIERAQGVVDILAPSGQDVGSLVLTGAGSALQLGEEGRLRAALPVGGQLLFRTHAGIEGELSQAQRAMIDQAIAAGRIAGMVVVQTQDAGAAVPRGQDDGEGVVVASTANGGEVTSSVTTTFDGLVKVVTAASRGRVELTISSHEKEGRTLLVALDPRTIPGLAQGKARILYDGEPIAQADSYADILDPSDDEGRGEVFILAGESGVQVLVSIPNFSVHVVTLEERLVDTDSPFFMYATGVLAAILVAETAYMAYRRKRSKSSTPPKEK